MTLEDWSVLERNELGKNYCETWGTNLSKRKLKHWPIISKACSVIEYS